MEDGMNPPPSQTMTADPSVVAAAVRVCDDILLASPTLTFMPAMQSNAYLPKTITIPIVDSAGVEVLTCIAELLKAADRGPIESRGRTIWEWNGSIATAEGVCVARVVTNFKYKTVTALAQGGGGKLRVEWGGEDFGQTECRVAGKPKTVGEFHIQRQKYLCCCESSVNASGVVYAQGPVHGISYGEDVTIKRQDLINLGVWLCPCTAGIICCFAALNYPPEFNIKNRAGENIGCITGDIDRQTQKHHKHDNGNHSKPTVMHFQGMTLEQRRLGLVAALHYMSTTWRGDM
jgi:hypothetical protein